MHELACDTKRKQLGEEFFSEFSPTDSRFLKNFNFSEFLNLIKPMKNCDISCNFLVEKIDVFLFLLLMLNHARNPCKIEKNAELREQRPFKVPLH